MNNNDFLSGLELTYLISDAHCSSSCCTLSRTSYKHDDVNDDGWVKEYVNAPGKHGDQWAAEFEQIYVRHLRGKCFVLK
jgi:hypothetical protein